MLFQKLFRFDLEEIVRYFLLKHLFDLKVFFIAFGINLLIYGQKLFFVSMPADDYMRYYGDDNTELLITNSARWAQALLNDYVFEGKLQILPYLHGIIGIFSLTLMGYLTAKYFKQGKAFELLIMTLLVSATPMFAHNLFFSTNITAWITLGLGVIGFLFLYRKNFFAKLTAFLFLVISIGNYQTIVQMIAVMVVIRFIIILLSAKHTNELVAAFWDAIGKILFVLAAYIASYLINEQFLHYHHWVAVHRLAQATAETGLMVYVTRVADLYRSFVKFDHFGEQFLYLYGAMAILAIIGTAKTVLIANTEPKLKMLSFVLTILSFATIPIIVNLPVLMGLEIPPRAHFTIGWTIAGFFALQMYTLRGILKTLSILISVSIIVVSTYYITLFFDAGIRQTKADMLRANIIVERIRTHKNYTEEPIGFHIVGGQKFNVLGWDMKFEQPFSTHWAKYKIFKYFTDLRFHPMSRSDLEKIERYIIGQGEKVYPYPGRNSVVVYKNSAVLFLNVGDLNNEIVKARYLDALPGDRPADINATFDLYLEDHLLYYRKAPCTAADTRDRFFLRIYPDKGKPALFYTLDFNFESSGRRDKEECTAVAELPDRDYWRLWTGQFNSVKNDWEVNYYPDRK